MLRRFSLIATARSGLLAAVLFFTVAAAAQDGTISGYVKTSDGASAAEVNVQLKEIKKATTSREDGSYSLTGVPQGNYTLIISLCWFKNHSKTGFGKCRRNGSAGFYAGGKYDGTLRHHRCRQPVGE